MTNNTPITLLVYTENYRNIIQMRNVTQLIDESIIIGPPPDEKWFVNVTRLDSDAEVSLTILKWHLVAIDVFVSSSIISPFPYFFALFIFVLHQVPPVEVVNANGGNGVDR